MSAPRELRRYDPCLAIAPGTWLIEASAGTGKTRAITDLVLRLVAEEGLRIDEILVVTFTQAATAELRQRVRARLVEAARALGTGEGAGDPVLSRLIASSAPQAARVRLRAALEDFDAAAISTIHGFCQRVLALHAFESRSELDLELLEDPGPLVEELVDDFLARAFAGAEARVAHFLRHACGLKREALCALARAALAHPTAELAPAPGDAPPAWEEALERFRARWQAGGREDLLGAIDADLAARAAKRGLLASRYYKRGSAQRSAARLDDWLARAGLPDAAGWAREAWVRHFTARQAEPFRHPVLDAWQAVVEAAGPLTQAPRLALAREVRAALPRRLEARGLLTFDELLQRIRARLDEPGLQAALRRHFRAALVDEFQDTDAVQWDIFRALFGSSPAHRLVLIGDPKQAIYAFRGADVLVYREAREHAHPFCRLTMTTNHRSDAAYLRALERLFGPPEDFVPRGPFDLDFVGFPPVEAAPERAESGLRFRGPRPACLPAPLSLRWFDGGSLAAPGGATPSRGDLLERAPGWLAGDVVELLAAGAEVRDGQAFRPLGPRDLAVLVRTNRQARAVEQALRASGVPAVLAQAGDVLETEEAEALERWLEALLAPDRDGPARALAATRMFAWTGPELAEAADPLAHRWAAWRAVIADWARLFERAGLTRAARAALEQPWREGAPSALAHLLGQPGGERRATDLRHALELLQAAATRERLGLASLLAWLRERRARGDLVTEARELRLESEAEAVQIVTLHKAKGLQYPVVFLPYAWDGGPRREDRGAPLLVHEPEGSTRLVLDLHLDARSPAREAREARAAEESHQEALRLLYVGLTRARHAAVALWGLGPKDAPTAALGTLLHGRARPGAPSGRAIARAAERIRAARAADDGGRGLLADLEAVCGADLGLAPIRPDARPTRTHPAAAATAAGPLEARSLGRAFDRTFRRSSYSGLLAAAEGRAAPEFEPAPGAEPDDHPPALPATPSTPDAPDLPGGRAAGRYVHRVLEELDFRTLCERADRPGNLGRTLPELAAALGRRCGFPAPEVHRALVDLLATALETPLGGELGALRLRALPPEDRLDELRFELPVAGGLAWRPGRPTASGAALAALLARPSGPWPPDYPARLAALRLPDLAGFLTGAVDLVFRHRSHGQERFYLADYKTNRVGPGEAALRAEMARHHYPLQYHLYLVALHRYLRWRLGPAYDYDRHVGGALYLFLRRMDGGPGTGVLFDRPPREVIEGLSRLFGEPAGDKA